MPRSGALPVTRSGLLRSRFDRHPRCLWRSSTLCESNRKTIRPDPWPSFSRKYIAYMNIMLRSLSARKRFMLKRWSKPIRALRRYTDRVSSTRDLTHSRSSCTFYSRHVSMERWDQIPRTGPLSPHAPCARGRRRTVSRMRAICCVDDTAHGARSATYRQCRRGKTSSKCRKNLLSTTSLSGNFLGQKLPKEEWKQRQPQSVFRVAVTRTSSCPTARS